MDAGSYDIRRTHLVRIVLVLLLVVPAVAWSQEPGLLNAIEDEIAAILERNRPSAVCIHTIHAGTEGEDGLQLGKRFTHGTGFVFDPAGYILTVAEAVRDADEIRVTLASGQQTQATLVAADPASEVAVIRVDADSLPVVSLGNSDRVQVGHYAFILGNAFGNLTPSFGSVHQIHEDRDLIQIVSPVNPGYGGAPVFCSTGEVAGMVWAALGPGASLGQSAQPQPETATSPVQGWQELPTSVFVIPINRAIQAARRLIAETETAYGWLGVEGEDGPQQGVHVTGISPEGPAAWSSIRPGDLILSYQRRRIAGLAHLIHLVLATPPGTPVALEVQRDGRQFSSRVQVGRMSSTLFAEVAEEMVGLAGIGWQADRKGPSPGRLRNLLPDAEVPRWSLDGMLAPQSPNREALSRRIDSLEREIWQLRRQLLRER